MREVAAELPLTHGRVAAKIKRARNDRFERDLAFQLRAHKMPEPAEQYRWATELQNENGRPRQFRADFAWPQFRLLIEVQGGVWRPGGGAHSHPTNIERDIEKQQCAVLLNWSVLPVTTDQVKNGKAIAIIERVLASRGWQR